MPYNEFTVAELQAVLDEIPGDAVVLLSARTSDMEKMTIHAGTKRAREVLVWGSQHNTYVIRNAYGCNDDRFDQPRTVLIEIGGETL